MGCGLCRNRIKFIDVAVRVTCDLCNGAGYLKEEAQPVTAVVDWKLGGGAR
jgi:hypothetical protein